MKNKPEDWEIWMETDCITSIIILNSFSNLILLNNSSSSEFKEGKYQSKVIFVSKLSFNLNSKMCLKIQWFRKYSIPTLQLLNLKSIFVLKPNLILKYTEFIWQTGWDNLFDQSPRKINQFLKLILADKKPSVFETYNLPSAVSYFISKFSLLKQVHQTIFQATLSM